MNPAADGPDIPGLWKVYYHIESLVQSPAQEDEHGNTWEQDQWWEPASYKFRPGFLYSQMQPLCGTAMCFAGWKLALDGYRPGDRDEFISPDGLPVDAAAEAAALLGLTREQRDLLFDGYNNLRMIRRIIEDIEAGRI